MSIDEMIKQKERADAKKANEIELAGFTMPANVVLTNGSSSMMLGNQYSNGINVSGIVERITYIGGGVMRIKVGEKSVLIFASGMAAEEK